MKGEGKGSGHGHALRSTSTMPCDTPASGARFICSFRPSHSLRSYLPDQQPRLLCRHPHKDMPAF